MQRYRYVREKGPICYAAPLFWRPDSGLFPDLIGRLNRVPVEWWWQSERRDQDRVTPLTKLTASTGERLLADLNDRDDDDLGRTVVLFAFGSPPSALGPEHARDAVDEFLSGKQGALDAVLVQLNDSKDDLVFVLQPPSAATITLWDELGWTSHTFADKPYSRLRTTQLENIVARR